MVYYMLSQKNVTTTG